MTALFCAFAPSRALAEEARPIAHSVDASGNVTNYYTYDEVEAQGPNADVVVMDADWHLKSAMTIQGKAKLTIDMQGHKVDCAYTCFWVKGSSELVLTSSTDPVDITYTGYNGETGSAMGITTTTGGLITATTDVSGGAFCVGDSSKLTLDNVTAGGSVARGASGGVSLGRNSTLTLKNGAKVEHNRGTAGAGVYCEDYGVTINLDNASISDNYCSGNGGGIYAKYNNTHVNMVNGAKISNNSANAGGGIYFNMSDVYIYSSDGEAYISGNTARGSSTTTSKSNQSGGGIHVNSSSGTNTALFENVTISGNYSAYDGGGLELDQKHTVLRGCKILDNWCKYEGGGIYVCENENRIEDCTITGNACSVESGGNYEGGGVYVWHSYDIEMMGACVIKGNTRGKDTGNADDVFLRENAGATAKAYITGSLKKGSSVGVRTGITGDRRVAKNFTYPATKDCLFADLDGYYISYGSDEGGDAWQRHATKEFELKVNGESVGRFKSGTSVTSNGTSADAAKVFKCWSADGSTGLYPFSDYVSEGSLKNPIITFSMPQNDVNIKAEYVTRTSDVSLSVEAPHVGTDLSIEGVLTWKPAGSDEVRTETVVVSWYEKKSDGRLTFAVGAAKAETTYIACVSLAQDINQDRAFALDLQADDVPVTMLEDNVQHNVGASEVAVDAAGTLNITSNEFTTASAAITGVEPVSLTFAVGTPRGDFMAALPEKATALKDNGGTREFEIDWSQMNFDNWFTDSGLKSNMHDVTYYLNLKDLDGVLPDGMKTVAVSFAFTSSAETVEVPEVSPRAGTYGVKADSARFDAGGTKMALTAACATDGAEIRYTLSRHDGSAWQTEVTDAAYTSGIDLAVAKGATASYRLEIWAVKGDTRSRRDVLYYTVEDDRAAETVSVTAGYTDTGADPVEGTIAESDVAKGEDVVLVAPSRPGYSFERWTGADGKTLGTDPTLRLTSVTEPVVVTAVYNPVVTALDVHLSLPEDDKPLAGTADKLLAKIGPSDSYVDVTGYFKKNDDGKVAIEWSPSDEKAAHATSYTATMSVSSLDSGVKYILAPDATVLVNGNDVAGGAYVVERDGRSSVCVRCPVTGPAEYESVAPLGTVELTYREALTAKASQAAGDGLSGWNLPSTVKVRYECGESGDYEIAWGDISALDESATGAQELTATGTISFADRSSYVSHDGDTETVTVKVRVAAKEAVKVPTASVKPGTYKAAQKVELECETEGAAIRYTTDGSDPTEGSPAYDGTAIEVSKTTEIRARAYADGMAPSDVATFAYTIDAGGDGKKDDSGKDDSGKKDDGKSDTDVDDSGNGNGSASGSNTTAATAATTEKPAAAKPLPRTGDYTLITVAALLVAGLVIVAAGIFVSRRKK